MKLTSESGIQNNLFSDEKSRILLVEDAESILIAMNDYLTNKFLVSACNNMDSAVCEIDKSIESGKFFDLVVSDIRLKESSGFDLVRYVKEKSPRTRVALITAYEINDFINYIYDESIDQVITKHSNLSLHDIQVMANKLIYGDIFGVDKYFPDIKVFFPSEMKNSIVPGNRQMFSLVLKSTEDKRYWMNIIAKMMYEKKKAPVSVIKLILDEIITNAMVRAPVHEDGDYKYQVKTAGADILKPLDNIVLDEEDFVLLQYGIYDDWIILACQDPHGTLRKKEILYRLHRQLSKDPKTKLPIGIQDSHGRGIFLLREHLTSLVFNIQKDKKTEVLAFYHTSETQPYKNISIYEI